MVASGAVGAVWLSHENRCAHNYFCLGWNEDSLESLSFTKTRVIEKNDAESLFQGLTF